jgi:diguanylate cyclase (GGDEF)-like protein/PAS domain S-box-containing protein
MKEKSTEIVAVWKKSRQWYWFSTAIFFVGIFSIILLLWVNHLSKRQHADSLLVDAAMDIEINAVAAHFLIEEAIGRNTKVDIKKIMEFTDEAIKIADSTLNGGETEHGRITEPLNDPNLRAYAESLRQNLVKFKTTALEHLQNPDKSGIGLITVQELNAIVLGVIKDAEEIDDRIGKNKTRNWENSRLLFMWIMIILISSITAATAGIWSYEKRQETAAAELYESEKNLKLYQALINQSNDSIEVLDPETGSFLKVNKKACTDLGYSREELLSMKVFDIDPIVKPSDFPKIMEDLRKTGAGIWNGVHLRKDGSTFPVEVSQKLVQLDRSYLVAVARDITERKQNEEALRESEELYADLFNGMLEGFALHKIICDEKGKPVDYRFLKINPAFERLTGLRAADLIGKTVLEVLPDTEPYWIDTYGRVALTGEPINFENYSRELERHFQVTAYSPRREQFVAIFEDITERKQAEESIKKLRRKNELILEAAGEGILGLDTEGHHTFVNPAAARTLGYPVEELIGKRSHELWHHTKPDGSPRPVEECPIYATFKNGAVHHETGDVFWKKDGSSFPVEYTSTPIIEQGNVVGAVVAFSDITKTIALRDKLEKLTITDALTGFYNLRGFLALAKPKLKLSLRKMENILLIYADMDNLKTINDNSGHQEGDKALAEVANILKNTFRESDILARLGGDEFAILAIDACDEKVIQERIQKNMDSYNNKVNPVHKLSLSVGIVCYDPEKPCTLNDLLSKADALMYENKLSKKG